MSHVLIDALTTVEDDVAKKKPQKPPKGRARERGDTVTFTFEMTPAVNAALEACARAEDRTKKAILTRALQQYLTAAGHPPIPDAEDDDGGE